MTNTRKFRPTDLSDAVSPARRRHRALIDAARRWQSGRDHPIDPDLFALICAGIDDTAEFAAEPVAPMAWTRMNVYHLLRCDIPNWCSLQRCLVPPELASALWVWIDFLHQTGRLDRTSDPVAELRKPLICCGWLDQCGHPLPADAPRPIVCECFLPYRETAELLVELVRQCERSGAEPLDRLRSAAGLPVEERAAGWPPWDDGGVAIDPDELRWAEPARDGWLRDELRDELLGELLGDNAQRNGAPRNGEPGDGEPDPDERR